MVTETKLHVSEYEALGEFSNLVFGELHEHADQLQLPWLSGVGVFNQGPHVPAYMALILAAICYSLVRTNARARTQLRPPLGVALINELKVQRCLCVCVVI